MCLVGGRKALARGRNSGRKKACWLCACGIPAEFPNIQSAANVTCAV